MTQTYHFLRPEIIPLIESGELLTAAPGQATRYAYAEAIIELAKVNPDVVVLNADVAKSIKTAAFAEAFPEREFNFGIAEQNMVAAAAGMATTGLIPFVTGYAVFLTMRALDQVRNSIHYPKAQRQDRVQPRRHHARPRRPHAPGPGGFEPDARHRQCHRHRGGGFADDEAGDVGGCRVRRSGLYELYPRSCALSSTPTIIRLRSARLSSSEKAATRPSWRSAIWSRSRWLRLRCWRRKA